MQIAYEVRVILATFVKRVKWPKFEQFKLKFERGKPRVLTVEEHEARSKAAWGALGVGKGHRSTEEMRRIGRERIARARARSEARLRAQRGEQVNPKELE